MLRGNHWRNWNTGGYVAFVGVDLPECCFPGNASFSRVLSEGSCAAPAVVDDFGNLVIVGPWK